MLEHLDQRGFADEGVTDYYNLDEVFALLLLADGAGS